MEHDINNLKIEVAVINEKLDSQGKKLDTVITMIEKHTTEESARFEEFSKTKADRTEVEKIQGNISKIVWVIIIAVVGAVLKLILVP